MKTLNKWNLELAKFAAPVKKIDGDRYSLNTVHVRADDTVATDGRVMVQVEKVEADPPKKVEASLKKIDGDLDDFCVGAKLARQVAQRIPKKTKSPQTPRAAFVKAKKIQEETTEVSFVIPGKDGRSLEVMTAERTQPVKFPDTDKVIPKGKPVLTVEYNGEMLGRVLQFMGKFSAPDYGAVKLSFYREKGSEEMGAVKIEATNRDTDQKALALVMPLSGKGGRA